MTSLMTTAAVTQLILALVPCLVMPLDRDGAVVDVATAEPVDTAEAGEPWWKTSGLGLDNYS
jgi:hypothetical protein